MSTPSIYQTRRASLMQWMNGGAALIGTAPVRIRSRDTDYRYRPDSDFYYLTGFREPHAWLLLLPDHPTHQSVLFLQARDPLAETWHGRRLGVERAPSVLGVDAAYPIDELDQVLPNLLRGHSRLYYHFGQYAEADQSVLKWLPNLANRVTVAPGEIISPQIRLHEMRLHKEAVELDAMRQAAAITAKGYEAALKAIGPGAREYEVEAALTGTYRRLGAEGHAYQPIVASGDNAVILHYNDNERQMRAGDLILIDSGAEYGYYACDISRTYPVSGRFSAAQKAVYQLVLNAQKAAIEKMRLGEHVKGYHEEAVRVLTYGMVDLGLLKGDPESLIQNDAYKAFYMHGTGHYLGLDTHDVGHYRLVDARGQQTAAWRPMREGMVLTCEPGLYIPEGADGIDSAFHGIGVRIEDDILITALGPVNLTADVPKEIDDIERLMAQRTEYVT